MISKSVVQFSQVKRGVAIASVASIRKKRKYVGGEPALLAPSALFRLSLLSRPASTAYDAKCAYVTSVTT